MNITLPFNAKHLLETVIDLKDTEFGHYQLVVSPSWPCYEEDGAGKITHLNIKLQFVDSMENVYNLTQEINED